MKKLLFLLLIPTALHAEDHNELLRQLLSQQRGVPVYQQSPEMDRLFRENYIRNGTLFGDSRPPPMDLGEATREAMGQAMRRSDMQWSDYESRKGRGFASPFNK